MEEEFEDRCNCNEDDGGCNNPDCECHILRTPLHEKTSIKILNNKEFDLLKEKFCSQCYFDNDDDRLILRKYCPHNCKHEEVIASIGNTRQCRICGIRIK